VSIQNDKTKVLVICMLDSVHSARWLSNFTNENIEFVLFPSTPNRKVHKLTENLIQNSDKTKAKYSINKKISIFSIPIWVIGYLTRLTFPALLIKKIVNQKNIQIIHAMELNHAGYLVNKVHDLGMPNHIKIISTNWGSDIFWFQRYSKHLHKIKKLMKISDIYSAECHRDLQLATKFGFTGVFRPVLPNSGGFLRTEIEKAQLLPPSSRKSIVIKGYESFVGRASIALEAIAEVKDLVSETEIHIYSANRKTIQLAKRLRNTTNLNITTYPKKSLSHEQMLELFRNARIYLGVSLSDGISTSLLEALATGAFPIQTNTSCAVEWITDGTSGFIVSPEKTSVASALKEALLNDKLVDTAAQLNHNTALEKLDSQNLQIQLSNFYST